MTSRGVAVLLLSAAVATSGRAAADVALIPAADGQLGAWLVKGPLPKTRAIEQADRASVHDRYRVVHARDGAIDLDRALAAGQKAGATALLGGTLELEHDLDGVLLASIDGAARLLVDGRQVWEKTARSLRGGGWDTIPLTLPSAGCPRVIPATVSGIRPANAPSREVSPTTILPVMRATPACRSVAARRASCALSRVGS